MDEKTMNAAVAYMEIWNFDGERMLDQQAAPNIEVNYPHFPEPIKGIHAWKEALRTTHHYFPDMKIAISEAFECKNKAIFHWSYTGTHKEGELFGVKRTGQKVTVQGITILELANDKVVKEYGVVDNFSLLAQLGKTEAISD